MKIDALFDSGSQENLIVVDLVKKLGLEFRDHPNPYLLGWVHKDAALKVLETLKKHQLLENLKKCKLAQQSLVYFGYVVGGGELKIDPSKMEAIMKWSVPTNVTEVRSFIEAAQYLRKFIALFLVVEALLHAIIASGKSFQWGKGQQKVFDELKKKISEAPILALPNL
eukprot:PITA_14012